MFPSATATPSSPRAVGRGANEAHEFWSLLAWASARGKLNADRTIIAIISMATGICICLLIGEPSERCLRINWHFTLILFNESMAATACLMSQANHIEDGYGFMLKEKLNG